MSLTVEREYRIEDDETKIHLNGNNLLLRGNNIDNVEIGSTFVDVGTTFRFDISNTRLGVNDLAPDHTLDVGGDCNLTGGEYKIDDVQVLSSTTLGSGVVNSSLTSVGTLDSLSVTNNINTVSGVYQVGGTEVLSSTTLGSGVVNSSLTSVGTLTSLNVSGNTNITGGQLTVNLDNQTESAPGLLVTAESLTGEDAYIEVRGSRNGSTSNDQGNLVFTNYDNDDGFSKRIGRISCRVTNATSNQGDMVFYNYSASPNIATETMRLTNNSRVGIGITNPVYKLVVSGDMSLAAGLYRINGVGILSSTTLGSSVVNSSLTSVGTLTSLTVSGDLTVDTNTLYVDSSNDRVGIGNISPDTKLEVTDTAAGLTSPLKLSNADSGGDVSLDLSTGAVGAITGRITNDSVGGGDRDLVFSAFNGTGSSLVEGIRIRGNTNNIGIGGITNPPYKLSVDGDTNITTGNVYRINGDEVLSSTTLGSGVTASSLTSVGTLGSLTVSGDVTVDTDTLYVDSTNNRVGIGLVDPDHKLEIAENAAGLTTPLKLSNSDVAGDVGIGFSTGVGGGLTGRITNFSVGDGNRDLIFSPFQTGTGIIESIRAHGATGNVGIGGITTPAYKLTVDGDTSLISGNVYRIAGNEVLSETSLGSGVVSSSLTSVGTLTSLNVSGTSNLSTTIINGELSVGDTITTVDVSEIKNVGSDPGEGIKISNVIFPSTETASIEVTNDSGIIFNTSTVERMNITDTNISVSHDMTSTNPIYGTNVGTGRYHNTTQLIGQNVDTTVEFNTQDWINGSNISYSSGNFTINEAGLFLICYKICYQQDTDGDRAAWIQQLSGATEIRRLGFQTLEANGMIETCISNSGIFLISSGHTIRIRTRNNDGNKNIGGVASTSLRSEVQIIKLGNF